MANPNYAPGQVRSDARGVAIDQGLRDYMAKVYALMAGAMVLTGLVAYVFGMDLKALVQGQPTTLIPESVLLAIFSSPLRWVVMLAPLGFALLFGAAINRMSASTAQTLFWVFGAVMGLSLASIFAVYTGESIARTFFITAAAFGGLSIWGYTTKRDLSGLGTFFMMGLIGLVVAMLINIFLESSALQWAISVIGVVLFAGLTAYDTQAIKNEYLGLRAQPGAEAWLEKGAVMGAFRLYLDFINLFVFLLQFLGNRE